MATRTLARPRPAAPLPFLPLSIVWMVPLALIGLLLPQGKPAPKFSGQCGESGDLKAYGDLTEAEHDELGAFSGWISYGKGTGE